CRDREQPEWGAYVLRSDGSDLRDLAPGFPFTETAPAWSPSGSELVISGKRRLIIAAIAGPRRVLPLEGAHVSWSPDGQSIAFSMGETIRIARPNGTQSREVFRNQERGTYSRGWGPYPEGLVAGPIVWSPDSKS